MSGTTYRRLIRTACWLLIIALSACSTTHSYRLNEVNSDLPIKVGDKVKIHEKYFGRKYSIVVMEVTEEAIKGSFPYDKSRVTTVPWDHIARIDLQQPDGGKTATLVVIILGILVLIAKSFANSLCDGPFKKSDDC